MAFERTIHLFCRVVDNFGDIGVCWRLARQLANEYASNVTLLVDDLASFRKICAAVDPRQPLQRIQGVTIAHWRDRSFALPEVADVVIEAFGCALPAAYIDAMATRHPQPAWINLEYLSAEPWVEGCHAMQSLYPSLPLIKYFFFPGFSGNTGGLLMEHDLIARRNAFQTHRATAPGFLQNIGVNAAAEAFTISLFCYPSAPVTELFNALKADTRPAICLVPQGVAMDAVSAFLRKPATVGATATRGGLTVQVVPFLDQPDYDKLLWACDLNFVRGEDSLVRAQWAAQPFVWQIYPQQEAVHLTKLRAFLDLYTAQMPNDMAHTVTTAWLAWNGVPEQPVAWQALRSAQPPLARHMRDWTGQLRKNGDLASNLIRFIKKIS